MSEHVDDLLRRVERLTATELSATHAEGIKAGRAAAEAVVAGTLRRVDFVARCTLAARRPHVHGEDAFALGFFEAVHQTLLRVPLPG